MLRAVDIFSRQEGQSFDLTQGVDIVDFFNAGIASPANTLEQEFEDLDIQSNVDADDNTANEDLERSRQNRANNELFDSNPQNESQFGFEDRGVQLGDFSIEPQSQPSSESPLPDSEPFEAASGVRVLDTTRDQLSSRKSVPGARIFSQDFNDDGTDKKVKGIEIVVPSDATKEEIEKAKAWVQRTHSTFKELGVDVPIRHGDGLKKGGRGVDGFFHLEDHFLDDVQARNAIKENPELFAQVTASTLGTISGSTFINPHKSNDPGAIGSDGIGERDFSKQFRTPFLISALNGDQPQRSAPTPQRSTSRSSSNRGEFAFDREARTDSSGNAILHQPPSSDANSLEIAGFGNKTNPEKFNQLRRLIDSGNRTGATELAKTFLAERGAPFTESIENDSVASVLNGVVHHRGESGFKKIASNLGVNGDNIGRKLEKLTSQSNFQSRWVIARAKQERENEQSVWKSKGSPGTLSQFRAKRRRELGGSSSVGSLGSFPKGLVNRWRLEAENLTT